MKKRLQVYLFMFIMVVSQLAIAQPISLTGTISDGETDDVLIGVSISIKGTTQGTVTDVNGFYQLNVPKGSTVVFSYIGYTGVEKQISDVSNLSFAMYPVYESLGELIVIGYGVQRKSDKTGAVSHISSDDLNIGASTDPLQTIVGKASGVVVTKGGGNPTDNARIKIRGSAGISGATNTNPLYVNAKCEDSTLNNLLTDNLKIY